MSSGEKVTAQQRAALGGRECAWVEQKPGHRTYRCPDREVSVWPECADCPFRSPLTTRTPVVDGNGEVVAADEAQYLRGLLDDALDRAQGAMQEVRDIIMQLRTLGGTEPEEGR